MKTATLDRYACFGTPHMHITVTYRGKTLHWRDTSSPGFVMAYADAVDYGAETIGAMIEHARRHGFTHVRFAGDWKGRSVRKTMRIPAGPYVHKVKPLAEILRDLEPCNGRAA